MSKEEYNQKYIEPVVIYGKTSDNTNVALPVKVDSTGALKVTGGASAVSAEFTSPIDFTATYTSATTITLSGVPFTITDSSQIAFVTVIPASGDAATYVNGSDGVTITISSNVITIAGITDPFASGDVYQVGINAQKKAYDPSTNSDQISNLNPDYSRYTSSETLVGTAQNLTDAAADVGAEIDCNGYNKLGVWLTVDINDSNDPRLIFLGKNESAGTEEYKLSSDFVNVGTNNTYAAAAASRYFELDDDADQFVYCEVDVSAIPYVQLQAYVATTGATVAQLDAVYITKSY